MTFGSVVVECCGCRPKSPASAASAAGLLLLRQGELHGPAVAAETAGGSEYPADAARDLAVLHPSLEVDEVARGILLVLSVDETALELAALRELPDAPLVEEIDIDDLLEGEVRLMVGLLKTTPVA